MTETRRAGRPTKASLARIKLVAVVLSIAAFIGSLAGVAIANPATRNRVASADQPAVVLPLRDGFQSAPGAQAQLDAGPLILPSAPQIPNSFNGNLRLRPLTRTRGS